MLTPQDVSVYLNNALKPTHQKAELDSDTALPETIREMPEEVSGHFVDLDPALRTEMSAAWKKVIMLNATQVLYTFTFEAETGRFSARKR
jgi:hypothetical protein